MVRPPSTAARRTTMSYTLAEAAAACGIDKSTVRRAVRSGRISGTRDDLGVWHVEASDCTAYSLRCKALRRSPGRCRETP